MKVGSKDVAQRLIDYLYHRISLKELVDWAEKMMMEAEFEEANFDTIRDVISRLGLADVKAFGITWEDCERFLGSLGYQVKVMIQERLAV